MRPVAKDDFLRGICRLEKFISHSSWGRRAVNFRGPSRFNGKFSRSDLVLVLADFRNGFNMVSGDAFLKF